jgi:hypothetical protein
MGSYGIGRWYGHGSLSYTCFGRPQYHRACPFACTCVHTHTLTCPFFQLRRGAGAGAAVGFSPAPWRFRHTEHSSPETVSAERVDTHINMMDASLSQRGASHGDIHAWVYLSVYLSMCVCVSLGY